MPPPLPLRRLPVVTILGVPNAGKSTLFNRLLGERRAIVTDLPGTTRDRIYARWRAGGKACLLCDTGGVADFQAEGLVAEIRRQTFIAVDEAAVVLLVLDARAGLTGADLDLAERLRPLAGRTLLVWNKSDSPRTALGAPEAFALGLGEAIPVSAEHGLGIADLVEAVAARLPAEAADLPPQPGEEIRVAIVGRPNVGKSSLLNRLCGEDRSSVGSEPGTTRDAVDTEVLAGGRVYRFVDTAGLRKPGRARGKVESLGLLYAKRSLSRSDVALVVFDAAEGLVSQDFAVAGLVEESGKGAVFVANKWDIVPDKDARLKQLSKEACARFRFARVAPIVSVSALRGLRVPVLFRFVDEVYAAGGITITTPRLNRFLETMRGSGAAPWGLRYMTQVATHPPTFLLIGSTAGRPADPGVSGRRRIENRLREAFGIGATPLRLRFRADPQGRARGRRREGRAGSLT
jgi:GTP-binding protein